MNKSGGRIFFFTNEVEIPFVEAEIANLALNFKQVFVYAFTKGNKLQFPENVLIREADYSGYSTSKVLFSDFFSVIRLSLIEIVKTPAYILYPSRYIKAISGLLRCFYLADEFRKTNEQIEKSDVFYSFWFNQWATVLALLKHRGIINKFYSRAHGTDLYEYRVPGTKAIPFRWYQLKQVTKVLSVSEKGMAYLKQKFGQYKEKIQSCYLGTADHGPGPFNEKDVFTIVSCAHVRNIKRIHLIPEIIKRIGFRIKWIHIGNENSASADPAVALYAKNRDELKRMDNVIVESKEKMTNREIFDFYKTTGVNLFISVSETEGLPVTMMEAISLGIPVLSTDVGGCSEIVNESTGILIEKEFDPAAVSALIKQFRESRKNSVEFRSQVREFWKNNFDGAVNFLSFLEAIETDSQVIR
ncbi:MAG: glycosyltransferase [Bacteroidia bacterium]